MFLEWKEDSAPFRDIMLYFQELYIAAFLKEFYFSKGNVTSAKKVAELCKKYEINRYKYVHTCFVGRKKEVEKIGFRYFNAESYIRYFVNKALDPDWYGAGTVPTPAFDRIKREIYKMKKDKISIVDSMLNGNLSPESFAYLIQTGELDARGYEDVIQPLAATFAKPDKKVDLWIKRGVLPREIGKMRETASFSEWCLNG